MRVAVVGTGFIGPVHIEALRRLGIPVVGILGSSPDRAGAKAKQLGISRVYADYRALLSDPDVDVVHITSPNALHFEQVSQAMQAGKHVVCEKPLAVSSDESAELVALAKEQGLVGAVNFNIRFYPLVHEAKARVARGEVGNVFSIHGSYLQDWLLYPTDWNWRLETETSGPMRAVADIGSHWLDLACFVAGQKVEAVMADFKTFLPVRQKPVGSVETFTGKTAIQQETVPVSIHTEDYASVMLRFENGTVGHVLVSQVSAGRKNRLSFELDGSEKSLAWDSERPNELWIGHRNRPNELLMRDPSLLDPSARQFADCPGGHNEGFPDTFKMLYRAVYRYIEAGDMSAPADFPTFEDGHYELLLGEAILRSSKSEKWEQVNR